MQKEKAAMKTTVAEKIFTAFFLWMLMCCFTDAGDGDQALHSVDKRLRMLIQNKENDAVGKPSTTKKLRKTAKKIRKRHKKRTKNSAIRTQPSSVNPNKFRPCDPALSTNVIPKPAPIAGDPASFPTEFAFLNNKSPEMPSAVNPPTPATKVTRSNIAGDPASFPTDPGFVDNKSPEMPSAAKSPTIVKIPTRCRLPGDPASFPTDHGFVFNKSPEIPSAVETTVSRPLSNIPGDPGAFPTDSAFVNNKSPAIPSAVKSPIPATKPNRNRLGGEPGS